MFVYNLHIELSTTSFTGMLESMLQYIGVKSSSHNDDKLRNIDQLS